MDAKALEKEGCRLENNNSAVTALETSLLMRLHGYPHESCERVLHDICNGVHPIDALQKENERISSEITEWDDTTKMSSHA